MVLVLLCHKLDTALAAYHCDTALAVHLALLNDLLAGFPA
jgi:hypothetical protein